MHARIPGHRAPLLWIALPFLAGLAAGRCGLAPPAAAILPAALAAAAVSVAAAVRRSPWWGPALILSAFLSGSASFLLHRPAVPAEDGRPPREARLELRLDRLDPSPNPRRSTGLATIAGGEPPFPGRVGRQVHFSLRRARGQPPLVRSSLVEAEGILAPVPRSPARGSFEERLALQGVEFTLTQGRLVRVLRAGNAYSRFCERLAAKMRSVLGLGLGRRPDVAAVYRAMMLGQKQDLTAGQRQLFLHSGTMHLLRCLLLPPITLSLRSRCIATSVTPSRKTYPCSDDPNGLTHFL